MLLAAGLQSGVVNAKVGQASELPQTPPGIVWQRTAPAPPPVFIPTPSLPPSGIVPTVPAGRPPLDLPIVKQPALAGFYPKALRKAGVEGSSRILLLLDRAGTVTSCQARPVSTVAALDAAACKFGLKLHFASTAIQYPAPFPIKIEWRKGGTRLVRAVDPIPPVIDRNVVVVREDDYPATARRAGAQGRVTVVMKVLTDGTVSNCVILGTSDSADLDNATCRLFRLRGRFRPALDEFGVPTEDWARQSVHWILAPDAPVPPMPQSAKH